MGTSRLPYGTSLSWKYGEALGVLGGDWVARRAIMAALVLLRSVGGPQVLPDVLVLAENATGEVHDDEGVVGVNTLGAAGVADADGGLEGLEEAAGRAWVLLGHGVVPGGEGLAGRMEPAFGIEPKDAVGGPLLRGSELGGQSPWKTVSSDWTSAV